jgi:hypothetical protein
LTSDAIVAVDAGALSGPTNLRTKDTRRAPRVTEQPGRTPSSPATGPPLRLSSAIITADGSRSRDRGPCRLLQLKLSVSARVLGGFDILLATTSKSREGAASSRAETPTAECLELQINPITLDSLPHLIHLSGRILSPHRDETAGRSYTLVLTFSNGSSTAMFWSTTFEVPRSPLVESRWHLTVPFNHSLTPTPPPCT